MSFIQIKLNFAFRKRVTSTIPSWIVYTIVSLRYSQNRKFCIESFVWKIQILTFAFIHCRSRDRDRKDRNRDDRDNKEREKDRDDDKEKEKLKSEKDKETDKDEGTDADVKLEKSEIKAECTENKGEPENN